MKFGETLFWMLGGIGIIDMATQAVTRGEVRPIRIVLAFLFS